MIGFIPFYMQTWEEYYIDVIFVQIKFIALHENADFRFTQYRYKSFGISYFLLTNKKFDIVTTQEMYLPSINGPTEGIRFISVRKIELL